MWRDREFWLLLLMLAALWALLSGGSASSWLIGAPAAVAGAWAGRALGLFDRAAPSIGGALHYLPFFLAESVRGGVDVTRRVLAPVPRVHPGLHDYRVSLRSPQARLLFVNSVSLLPGTLAADLRDDTLVVHALDASMAVDEELRRLERSVGRVFGETL
ncbi:MAG: Na+/H+ antiporter subunit E [Gammaproteobacteria bacterium]|nr:Na+/H+ antiporter subunit E [Gammaproteobacteria bacterium]